MKNYIKHILFLLISVGLFQSCDDGDKTVDYVFDNITRGATLRTMNIINGTVNIFDVDNSVFEVELEYRDHEEGALLDSYDVYTSFRDNTDDGVDNSKPEVFLKTVTRDQMPVNPEFGFPRGVLQITATESLAALGLSPDQLNGGDQVVYRLVLKLTDGREFTNDASGQVTGGSFYSSPFAYNASVVCLFDEPDFFSGTYLLQQVAGAGGFGVTFADQLVEIAADGINRTTTVIYFPGFDLASPFRMEFICGEIIVLPNEVGLSCGGDNIGWTQGAVAATFDTEFIEDDVIDVNIEDANPDGSCGAGSGQVTLRFTDRKSVV